MVRSAGDRRDLGPPARSSLLKPVPVSRRAEMTRWRPRVRSPRHDRSSFLLFCGPRIAPLWCPEPSPLWYAQQRRRCPARGPRARQSAQRGTVPAAPAAPPPFLPRVAVREAVRRWCGFSRKSDGGTPPISYRALRAAAPRTFGATRFHRDRWSRAAKRPRRPVADSSLQDLRSHPREPNRLGPKDHDMVLETNPTASPRAAPPPSRHSSVLLPNWAGQLARRPRWFGFRRPEACWRTLQGPPAGRLAPDREKKSPHFGHALRRDDRRSAAAAAPANLPNLALEEKKKKFVRPGSPITPLNDPEKVGGAGSARRLARGPARPNGGALI